jgi:iron complex outermembrane recepter protein
MALAMGGSVAAAWPGVAQQPEATGQSAMQLPEVSVEAPAKRNIPKAVLRQQPSPGTTTSVPGIVVEGEKVLRTLRDTTTSTGVVTGQEIKDRQILDLQEALNSTPNVLANEGNRGNSGFVIRGLNSEGLTQNQSASAASLVSVVIDGATQNPEATRRGARALWDVEQVEILRGPQSTLQARNSLAGTVFVKTNDPVYKFESTVEGTLGSFGLWNRAFVVNTPIVGNQFAVRIAGQLAQGEHDIGYTNAANNRLDNDRLANLRGKVLIEPNSVPGLSVLLTAARTEDRPAVTSVSEPNFFARILADDPTNVDFRSTNANNYIADVSYQVAPNYKVRSITAFANTDTEIVSAEGSRTPRDDTRNGTDFTQDLRLEIDKKGNGLSGVLGLFYGRFGTDIDSLITSVDLGGATVQDLLAKHTTTSVAAYGELRYRFMDRYQLIGGGRLLHDVIESRADGQTIDLFPFICCGEFPGQVLINENNKAEYTRALPKVGMTYDLDRNQTVGFTFSKGYRAGFFHLPIGTTAVSEVKPEDLNAYELSYRSTWAGGRFYLGGNIFYYDYKNQQIAMEHPTIIGSTFIVNGNKSHAYGAEIEARWRPDDRWQLVAGLGLIQTRFDDFVTIIPVPPLGTVGGNFTGNEFPESPAMSFMVAAHYKDPSGWFAGANLRYVDGFYSNNDVANTPIRFVSSYTIVDARIGYEWEQSKTKLTLFAKNILDEQYVTSLSADNGGPAGPNQATVGDGRLVGVTLTQRF